MLILLGGSFDPVHNGHLYIAHCLQKLFLDAELCFIPCKQPVIEKKLQASSEDRVRMLKLAIEERNADWRIDSRELHRATCSYTQETLLSFRKEYPNRSIVFVMGSDVFSKLDQEWGVHWRALITHAHVLVVERVTDLKPTISFPLQQWFTQYQTKDYKSLEKLPSGQVCKLDIQAPFLSSTEIRQALARGQIPTGLPDQVLHYIIKNHLYGFLQEV